MNIRRAAIGDAEAIQVLLAQLGYPTLDGLIERRLAVLAGNSEHADLMHIAFIGDRAMRNTVRLL
jgi:N-acetylglutamate synthase-like GNAT family acetyltransferase